MTNLKKFLLILSSAVMCLSVCACSVGPAEDSSTSDSSSVSENEDSSADESADESTEEATEEAPVQADIPLEFDGSEVPDAAAKTIGAYFKAIMNQDYNSYKETLEEKTAVETFMEDIPANWGQITRMEIVNRKNSPPILYILEKK